MRVVVAQPPGETNETIRRMLLGMGLECSGEDCVALAELPVRLARGGTDLVLVRAGAEPPAALEAIRQAMPLTSAPILAMGPANDARQVMETVNAGARHYLDEQNLQIALEDALKKLHASGAVKGDVHQVIGVLSANPGAGVTTIATNLAFLWGQQAKGRIALLELGRGVPTIALSLENFEPNFSPADMTREVDRMDTLMLRQGMKVQDGLVHILAYKPETLETSALEPRAVRKMTLLARAAFAVTVLDLGCTLGEEQIEALRLCDQVLLVVRLDVPGLRLARRLRPVLVEKGIPANRIRLVANRYGERGQIAWGKAEQTLGEKFTDYLPDDPGRINKSVDFGRPAALEGSFGYAGRIQKLARAILPQPAR